MASLATLMPGGIALLAPTGSKLWRYERAFEARAPNRLSGWEKDCSAVRRFRTSSRLRACWPTNADTLAFEALMRGQ